MEGNWIGIVGCVTAVAFSTWYLHPVWLLLIAARQHALLILLHDASHFLICRSKAWNDLIGDLLCGFPFGVATRSYRANHISHHEHLNTSDDPYLVRTVGPRSHPEEWLFPMPHYRCSPSLHRTCWAAASWMLLRLCLSWQGKEKRARKPNVSIAGRDWYEELSSLPWPLCCTSVTSLG